MTSGLGWLDPKAPRNIGSNKHVLWARVILPLIAVLLFISSIIWAQLGKSVEVKKIDMKDVQNTLETARFSSVDKEGRPYVIEADKVTQQDPTNMTATLEAPKGELSLKDGGTLSVKANDGVYKHNEQKLHLNGGVILQRNKDFTMKTDALDVDMSQNSATGDKPVTAETLNGDQLNAQNGLDMNEEGNLLIFKGPATLTLQPKSQKLDP